MIQHIFLDLFWKNQLVPKNVHLLAKILGLVPLLKGLYLLDFKSKKEDSSSFLKLQWWQVDQRTTKNDASLTLKFYCGILNILETQNFPESWKNSKPQLCGWVWFFSWVVYMHAVLAHVPLHEFFQFFLVGMYVQPRFPNWGGGFEQINCHETWGFWADFHPKQRL